MSEATGGTQTADSEQGTGDEQPIAGTDQRPDDEQPPAEPDVAAPAEPGDFGPTRGTILGGLLGALAVLAALAVIVRPELAPVFDAGVILEMVMAGTAIVAFVVLGHRYLHGDRDAADPPLVEYRSTISIPGAAFDGELTGISVSGPIGSYRTLTAIKDRLRPLAESILERTGVPVADVDEQLDSGGWTDDWVAGSFFAAKWPFDVGERLRIRMDGDGPRERQARHVIDRLARRLSIGDRDWTDPSSPGDVSTLKAGWIGRLADVERRDRETKRWRIVAGTTLLVVGVGVLLRTASLVLAGAVGMGLVAYRYIGTAPTPTLLVERSVDEADPVPGEEVRVTVSVTNAGDGMLFDLRLIDGVPPGLSVVEGSPRHGASLQPGATARFAYVVEADRGDHVFEEVLVLARDASGGVERAGSVGADGQTHLRCEPRPTEDLDVPVRSKTSRDVGRVVTDTGGSGLEFHSVREYRVGDPLKRIDWNRAARGQELATLQFREEHAATVVLLIDARPDAFVAHEREAASALERSLGAAAEVFHSRLDSDDRVGLGALAAEDCWLAPGAGHGHWPLARELLTNNSAFTENKRDRSFYPILALRRLRKQLPNNAQLVLFSPLCDDDAVWIARRLHAYGYPMTVVSPDATTTVSPGRTVAHMERRLRLSRLRDADVRVIDWDPDEPLEAATDRAQRRWSR